MIMEVTKEAIYDLRRENSPLFGYVSISNTPLPNNPKAYTKGFSYEFVEWEQLHKVTQNFSYSNAIFKDGYRKIDNIIGFGNLIIFDVDNHYNINTVRKDLMGVKSLIVTTQSHTEEHHKFRIIIPTNKCLSANISKDLYREILSVTAEQICGLDVDKIDKACLGMDRQYAPAKNQKHRYIAGDVLPLDYIVDIAREELKAKSITKIEPIQIKHTPSRAKNSYTEKREFIKANFTPEFMIGLLTQRGLTVKTDGTVIIPSNKTQAIKVDLKSGFVRDFSKNVSYDPIGVLYDIYHAGTLTEITDTIYEQLRNIA